MKELVIEGVEGEAEVEGRVVLIKAVEAVRQVQSKRPLEYRRQIKKWYLKKIWGREKFDERVSRKEG